MPTTTIFLFLAVLVLLLARAAPARVRPSQEKAATVTYTSGWAGKGRVRSGHEKIPARNPVRSPKSSEIKLFLPIKACFGPRKRKLLQKFDVLKHKNQVTQKEYMKKTQKNGGFSNYTPKVRVNFMNFGYRAGPQAAGWAMPALSCIALKRL